MDLNAMWYKTREEAEKACREKEKQFHREFYVLKDSEKDNCYWAQRNIKEGFLSTEWHEWNLYEKLLPDKFFV